MRLKVQNETKNPIQPVDARRKAKGISRVQGGGGYPESVNMHYNDNKTMVDEREMGVGVRNDGAGDRRRRGACYGGKEIRVSSRG